jgi:hypothetical protein
MATDRITTLEESPPDDGPQARFYSVIGAGTGLVLLGLGVLVDQAGPISALDIPRLVVGFLAILGAGIGLSLAPGKPFGWAGLGLAFLGASLGFPAEWDSYRMFCRIGAMFTLLFAVGWILPRPVRFVLAGAWILFHFIGILSAVLSPSPQPWSMHQLWVRVYRPYLQFLYMNNAYQFYSPDPGPATMFWCCLEYHLPKDVAPTADKPKRLVQWVKFPTRPTMYRDPLGQSYYRRLALTELASSTSPPSYDVNSQEYQAMQRRRDARRDIPYHPVSDFNTPRFPAALAQRIVLPSYIRHIAWEYPVEGYEIHSLKLYRVLHEIIPVPSFVGKMTPDSNPLSVYEPSSYVPTFQGEFDINGELIDKQEPLLYWVTPILIRPGMKPPLGNPQTWSDEEYAKYYDDSLIRHAGSNHRVTGLQTLKDEEGGSK